MRTRVWFSLIVLLAVTSFATCVRADDDDDGPANDDRSGVARVSLIHGDVSMQRGDSEDWAAASINTPLVRGDQVATGERSRMEVQLDYANILRLSSSSQAKIADLTRTRIQIQLAQGYANYTVFKGSEADVEIDTPNVAVRPLKPGRYRVQVNSDYETDVIVRDGEAEISTPQGSTTVREGRMAMIRGEDNPEYRVDDAPRRDDWDRWNKDRDNTIREAQGYRQTSPYYTGAQDLDGYGRWVYVPGYGRVWQPYEQSASWAPYQSGRWVWEPYWGWTWVSYEPWGWAPYHYGRWFYWRSAWVWWPGPVQSYYRPVWSPAFVTFIGFGHHSGFAFGFGSIGWIPCGPSDYYYPWYGRGYNRVNVVNITNITNVRNVHYVVRPLAVPGRQHYYSNVDMALRNPRVRRGISGVDADDFGRGHGRVHRLDVGDRDLRDSRVMTGNLPVVPTRDSLHAGGGAPVRMNIRPRQEERFYTRRQPPAGPPAFHDQVSRMQQVVGEHTQPAQVPMTRGSDGQGVRPSGIYRIPPSGQQGDANRGGFHTQPAQVPMTRGSDGQGARPSGIYRIPPNGQQGNANRTDGQPQRNGNAEVPNRGGDRGGWRSFGGGNRPDTGNQGTLRRPGNEGMPGRGNGNGGTSVTASPEPQQRDRGGWQRFPSRNNGGSNGSSQDSATPGPRGSDRGNPRVDRSGAPDRNASGSGSGDNGGFRRFPPPSERTPQQPDRTQQPSSAPENRSGNGGGWQRFPSNSDRGTRDNPSMNRGDRTDAGSRPYSKPRLDLEKPIVRPRSSDVRMEPRRESPPPRQMRSEPSRSMPSPSPSRGPSMRGGGGSAPHISPSPSRGGGNSRGGDKGRGKDH
jgi:hypothetical protein